MSEKNTKRRTIRLSTFVDNELVAIAEKNKINVNKLISEIILYHIDELGKVNNVANVSTILNKLETLENDMEYFKQKYHWINALLKQIFVNEGYRKNNDLSDPIYQEFVNKKFKNKYGSKDDS